jgi:hypothetical protein
MITVSPRPSAAFSSWAIALMLVAVAGYSVVPPLIDDCDWFRAVAQAPTGHRQPTPADVSKIDPSKNDAIDAPVNRAMERALNNICRGCSPIIPVSNVPRYNLVLTCGAAASSGQDDTCRRDEEAARNQLSTQWTQFGAASRSNCVQTAAIGGRPSYVQLLICLQLRRTAPTLPDVR